MLLLFLLAIFVVLVGYSILYLTECCLVTCLGSCTATSTPDNRYKTEIVSIRTVHPFMIHTFCVYIHLDVWLMHLDCSHHSGTAEMQRFSQH